MEAIYREGLSDLPNNPELLGNFAMFMEDVRGNYDEALKLYRRALELDPQNKLVRKNYEAIRKKQKSPSKSLSVKTGNLRGMGRPLQ